MKRFIRNACVFIFFSPLIVFIHLSSLVVGKEKITRLIGPALTRVAKQSLWWWAPTIVRPEDFDIFVAVMKSLFHYWKPFYDISIAEETNDIFRLRISNCPFCEVFNSTGLNHLSPYVCESDWVVARDNKDMWGFERKHQIGSGDAFCDHTYIKKANP
jgi:hypothetical protein